MMEGDFDKEKIKKVLNKTLKDIQKFEKFSQEDQKKLKICCQKKNRLQHTVTSFLEKKQSP